MAEPPHHPTVALLGEIIAGQKQHELVGNLQALDVQPHAARGNVGDKTVARQAAVAELNLGHAVDEPPSRPAPVAGISWLNEGDAFHHGRRSGRRPLVVVSQAMKPYDQQLASLLIKNSELEEKTTPQLV